MSTRFDPGFLLNVHTPAFAVVSGAISGTTPKVSSWIKLVAVESMAFHLTTTSSATGVWTAEVAQDGNGKQAKALPNPPTFPTGTGQDSVVTVTMPGDEFVYLRLTFTPSAGVGNAVANCGAIVGQPFRIHRNRYVGLHWYVPAADTLAATNALEYSFNYDGRKNPGDPTDTPRLNNLDDPCRWTAATDVEDDPYALPDTVASTGTDQPYRLGALECVAIRAKATITAGFGTIKVVANGKS